MMEEQNGIQAVEEKQTDPEQQVDPEPETEDVKMATVYADIEALSQTTTDTTHQEHMENFLHNTLLMQKNHLMTEQKFNALLEYLRDPQNPKCSPKFRHWASKRHEFSLKVDTVNGLMVETVVVPVMIMDEDGSGSKRVMVTVIPTTALYDVTEDIHINKLNHGGYKRVKRYAEDHYFGITRTYVQEFCRTCPVCQDNSRPRIPVRMEQSRRGVRRVSTPIAGSGKRVQPCRNTPGIKHAKFAQRVLKQHQDSPVLPHSDRRKSGKNVQDMTLSESCDVENAKSVDKRFMARVQVDLINMTAMPDRDYHYICHVLDFFSKYHVLFPLQDCSADEIAKGLRDKVFAYFGPAEKVYIGGGGRKFVHDALSLLTQLWPDITIILGKNTDVISPQRVAKAVDVELAAIKKELQLEDGDIFPWIDHLAKVMFRLNQQKPDPTLDTPYGVVLGHPPLTSTPLPGLAGTVIVEERLEKLIGELIG